MSTKSTTPVDRPIEVGDLVTVVRGHSCVCEVLGGMVWTVSAIVAQTGGGWFCQRCGASDIAPEAKFAAQGVPHTGVKLNYTNHGPSGGIPLGWLKRIPAEGFKTPELAAEKWNRRTIASAALAYSVDAKALEIAEQFKSWTLSDGAGDMARELIRLSKLAPSTAKLDKLSAAASKGPWEVFDQQGTIQIGHAGKAGDRPCVIEWGGFDASDKPMAERRANARLIVALVNALRAGELAVSAKRAPNNG